jgi:hypothetical protein
MGEKYEVPPLSAGEFWNEVLSCGREDGSGMGKRGGRPDTVACALCIPPLVLVDEDRRLRLEALRLIGNSEWPPFSCPE